jgi:predicted ATPase
VPSPLCSFSVSPCQTHGNPTSVLRFLEILQQDGLLCFSVTKCRWEWDTELINNSTTVTNDVGELLAARIKYLPPKSLGVLKLAACIGFSFHKQILEHLAAEDFFLQGTQGEGSIEEIQNRCQDELNQILEESSNAGLVVVTDQDSIYSFSHDLIYQNLYAKLKEDEVNRLHLRIARVMQGKSYYGSSSLNLFITVNHFNCGYPQIESEDERMVVVELNLEASVAARAGYSFRSAAIFLEKAIAILKREQDWLKHYSLVLEVFSSAAEVHFTCGDLRQSISYAGEVIRHARCTADSVRGHFIKVDILGREQRYTQALEEGFRILDILGCKVPRTMKRLHLYLDLAKIKQRVTGKTIDYFLAMKPMTDVVQLASLRLMDTMTLFFALRGDDSMAGLLLTRMMLTTLKNGLSIYSSYSFASYGLLLYYLGDAESGHRFGTLGLRIAENLRSKRALTRTAFVFYTFLNHLKKPLTDGIEPMLNAHRIGLQMGDVEYSSMCL